MKSQKLGRGLDSLFGEMEEAYDNEGTQRDEILEIPLQDIKSNPFQPRKLFNEESLQELAASIKNDGLLQPIVVREDIDGYILITGERRFRASKRAKMQTIRAIVLNGDEDKMRQFALIENIQREQLNAIELAEAYQELLKLHKITHEKLSVMIHKSRTHITNTVRLLQLSKLAKKALIEEKISAGHAKMLVVLDEKQQQLIVNSIINQKLNVRDTAQIIKSFKEQNNMNECLEKKTIVSKSCDFSKIENICNRYNIKYKVKNNELSLSFDSENKIEEFLSHFH